MPILSLKIFGRLLILTFRFNIGIEWLSKEDSIRFTWKGKEKSNRCCGRCNGIDDICVTDTTCEPHRILGCEICFGKRGWRE